MIPKINSLHLHIKKNNVYRVILLSNINILPEKRSKFPLIINYQRNETILDPEIYGTFIERWQESFEPIHNEYIQLEMPFVELSNAIIQNKSYYFKTREDFDAALKRLQNSNYEYSVVKNHY